MSDRERQIQRVIGLYEAAVLARDVEAFMRLYHPTVRVFDAWGVWLYEDAPSFTASSATAFRSGVVRGMRQT